jgi:predicted nucleic acid-binding protein
VLGVDLELAGEAGRLAEEHGLRGYDAVHLASALALKETTMVTWDGDLRAAAAREGLDLAPAGVTA